jgi:hypothetical protein
MKLLRKGKKIFNAATGNEVRFRWTPRIIYYAVCAAYGWYMAHLLGRMGIRLGLRVIPNITMVFTVVIGGMLMLRWLFNKYLGERPVHQWLIPIIFYEVKPPIPN